LNAVAACAAVPKLCTGSNKQAGSDEPKYWHGIHRFKLRRLAKEHAVPDRGSDEPWVYPKVER
jgi:hypothetical protein